MEVTAKHGSSVVEHRDSTRSTKQQFRRKAAAWLTSSSQFKFLPGPWSMTRSLFQKSPSNSAVFTHQINIG